MRQAPRRRGASRAPGAEGADPRTCPLCAWGLFYDYEWCGGDGRKTWAPGRQMPGPMCSTVEPARGGDFARPREPLQAAGWRGLQSLRERAGGGSGGRGRLTSPLGWGGCMRGYGGGWFARWGSWEDESWGLFLVFLLESTRGGKCLSEAQVLSLLGKLPQLAARGVAVSGSSSILVSLDTYGNNWERAFVVSIEVHG